MRLWTGDLSQLPWTNDARYPWFVTTTGNPNGTYCMKSGNGGVTYDHANYGNVEFDGNPDNTFYSNSNISTSAYFDEAGTISFRARISSEANWDYGYFYIDDVEKYKQGTAI